MFTFTKIILVVAATAVLSSASPLAQPGVVLGGVGPRADVTLMTVWEQCYKNCMKNVNVSDKWDTKEKKEKHCNTKCRGHEGEPAGLIYKSDSDSDY